MKIGCSNHPRRDLIEEVRWIAANGFHFLDLFMEPDAALPDRVAVGLLKQTLADAGMPVVGHTAWYLPFGSPYPELRRQAVEIVCGYLPFLRELGCPLLTVHANWAPGLFSDRECIDFQLCSLEPLLTSAERSQVRLIYEPLDTSRDTLDNLAVLLSRLPDLLIHLDLGHAHLCGLEPEAFFRRFPGKVAHIHLHDNDGRRDLHLPPGTGSIDWIRILRQVRRHYDGTITVEVFSQDRDYLLLSRKKLEEYWQEAGHLP